jgi:hypothetical protein
MGDAEGGSTAFGIGSAAEAADEAEQQPDPDDGEDQLARCQGEGEVMVLDRLGEALGVLGHASLLRSAASAIASMIFV